MSPKHGGYINYQTWNVALWIANEETLYALARTCVAKPHPYRAFVYELRKKLNGDSNVSIYFETPDGVSWNDSGLDLVSLDWLIRGLK